MTREEWRAEVKARFTAGPNQCQMIDAHHPDCECEPCRARIDPECRRPSVGMLRNGKDRVCRECARYFDEDPEVDTVDYLYATIGETDVEGQ